MGYRARRNGVDGVIMAGHGINQKSPSYPHSVNGWSTAIGQVPDASARVMRGSADCAFVATNSQHTPVNRLRDTQNMLSTTIGSPGAGTVINKIGEKTGHTGNTIISTNASITMTYFLNTSDQYSLVLSNLTSVNNKSGNTVRVFANNGDSGGIVYSYISSTNTRPALGIITAGSDTVACYSKASLINAALGCVRY